MTRTRWIIFAVICLAVLGGLVFFSTRDKIDVSKIDEKKVVTVGAIEDHVFGNTTSKALLIEYGDFQCPGCGKLYPILAPLKAHYKKQLAFVFRDFPLTSLHPNALTAASAAEAAGLQGKFFEMHNKLYETQQAWSQSNSTDRLSIFKQYANEVGLDVTKFEKDLSSKVVAEKIRRDQALGAKAKVNSTPTLFLNGETIGNDTWGDSAKLETKLREAIKSSGQKLPKPINSGLE